jgi:RimJ/RimL family protein N-acetyltransferase
MFESILATYHQIREAYAEGGFRNVIRHRIYWQRALTPAELDLTIAPAFRAPKGNEYQFIELSLKDLLNRKWTFTVPSRQHKSIRNLKRGFRGFAVAHGVSVVGDLWSTASANDYGRPSHPDLKTLGIRGQVKEAYSFDMLIDPEYRGKHLAIPLHRYLQSILREEGYQKLYTYYWNDAIPSVWMHRWLGFQELPEQRVSRFFFFQHVEAPSRK